MSEDRKAEILQAFMKLVSRFGLDKTTMQDIAKEAGVSVGVIYKDYTNKDELIDAYANLIVTRIIGEYHNLVDRTCPPEQQLHNLIIGSFKLIHRNIINDLGIHQILADDNSLKYLRENFSRKTEIEKVFIDLIAAIMEEGVKQGVFQIENIPETAVLFSEAFDGYFIKGILGGDNIDKFLPKVETMFRFLLKKVKK
mgnify:CR=1 FL=1